MINVWAADYGDITLPSDFPVACLTVSGWYDKRFKIVSDARQYIAEQETKLRLGKKRSGFQGPSFARWQCTK